MKKILGVIIIIGALILAGGSIYVWPKYFSKNSKNNQATASAEEQRLPMSSVEPEKNLTLPTIWKTYNSEKMGISFEAPIDSLEEYYKDYRETDQPKLSGVKWRMSSAKDLRIILKAISVDYQVPIEADPLDISTRWIWNGNQYLIWNKTEVMPVNQFKTTNGIPAIIIDIKDNPAVFIPDKDGNDERSRQAAVGRDDLAAIINLPTDYNKDNKIKCIVVQFSNQSGLAMADMERIINSIKFID